MIEYRRVVWIYLVIEYQFVVDHQQWSEVDVYYLEIVDDWLVFVDDDDEVCVRWNEVYQVDEMVFHDVVWN